MEALQRRLDSAPDDAARSAIVDSFWQLHPRTPLIEPVDRPGERIVTFLWRESASGADATADGTSDTAEVLLFVNRITDERNLGASLMRRFEGADLWHLSYLMRHDWRASYGFVTRAQGEAWPWDDGDQVSIRHALDRGRFDPRNPATCRNRPGTTMSVVELPEAPPQPWLVRREGLAARGTVTRLSGPGGRPVWVYDPPRTHLPVSGVDPTEHPVLARPPAPLPGPLPVVVLFDGEVWTSTQRIADTVDNLIADGLIRPCLVVMPESGDRGSRWKALDADGDTSDWVVNELLPWVRSFAPASMQPDDIIVAGQSLGAYTALRCALEHPEAVGAVLSQSASLWQRELRARAPELVHRVHAYIEVGEQEWVLREPNRDLASAFVAAGADVHYVEYNGGHDYACWRGGIADGLRALLGPPRHRHGVHHRGGGDRV